MQNATDTDGDGLVTEPLADESAGEGSNIDGCLYQAEDGVAGYRYECGLEYDLTVRATVTPGLGSAFEVQRGIVGVVTRNEGTYEHPLAMACCGDLSPIPADTCTTDHHRACFSDHLSQACITAGALLDALGDDQGIGSGGLALKKAAKELKSRANDCYSHLWSGPDDIAGQTEVDSCSVAHNSFFEHAPFEPAFSVTYGVFAVSDVVVELRSSLGNSVVAPLPADPIICNDPRQNDGDLPPFSGPGSAGNFLSPTAPIPVNVAGPQWSGQTMSGSGDFATASSLHRRFLSNSSLLVDEMIMVEEAPTTVGTSSIQADVEGFILRLEDPVTATLVGKYYSVSPGGARFALAASVDGQGSYVQATNSEKIQFYTVSGGFSGCPTSVPQCLANRPFSIGYTDAFGGQWDIDVASGVWKP